MITTSVLSLVIILIFSNSGGTFAADWSYKNEETWPAECIKGKEQSPIALSESAAEEKSFPEFVFEQYDDRYMAKIKNNGHAGMK
jgi:carbonic anhydrase